VARQTAGAVTSPAAPVPDPRHELPVYEVGAPHLVERHGRRAKQGVSASGAARRRCRRQGPARAGRRVRTPPSLPVTRAGRRAGQADPGHGCPARDTERETSCRHPARPRACRG